MKKKELEKELTFLTQRTHEATWRAHEAESLLLDLIHHVGVSNIPRDLGERYLTIKRRSDEENAIWDRWLLRHRPTP